MAELPTLGRLSEVSLCKVWSSEPYSFTPWLAQSENLHFLAESLELPGLELVRTEHPVDNFSADIVCKIIDTDDFVLIENQLERTDHIHVGQLLTYAAKFDASAIVWIAKVFTESHRAALDWLNRISSDEYGFFGVEVRAVTIGNSTPAPLFNVIAKPNDWIKPEGLQTPKDSKLSERSQDNVVFWSAFDDALEDDGVLTRRNRHETKGQNAWIPLAKDSTAYLVAYRSFAGQGSIGINLGLYKSEELDELQTRYTEILETKLPDLLARSECTPNSTGTVRYLTIGELDVAELDKSDQIGWLLEQVNEVGPIVADPDLLRSS